MSTLSLDTSSVELRVNGHVTQVAVADDETLADTLRRIGLFSVRTTCGVGVCGTCTVLIDGDVVSSCLILPMMVAGSDVLTAEGLVREDGSLDPVQEAFARHRAYQCSFCTPAMTLTVRAALADGSPISLEQVKELLSGNLCRCGTYPQVEEAVMHAMGSCKTCPAAAQMEA